MKQVYKNLLIGTVEDYEQNKEEKSFYFVSACKEPIHRNILGYKTRGCPKDNEEYFYAIRDNIIALNLVDASTPEFFNNDTFRIALEKIHENLCNGKSVLVFCNQGKSRSASIVMLYLASIDFFIDNSYAEAKMKFAELYPEFEPSKGIDEYMNLNWTYYNE